MWGLTVKYAFMAFIHWTASSVSPEKSVGRAALISVVLVDIGFAGGGGGLTGVWGGGTVDEGAVVARGVTGGKGLVTGMLGSELEGGNGVMCLGGEGREAGLAVY